MGGEGGGGLGCTPSYGLNVVMPPDRIWFLPSLAKHGIYILPCESILDRV